jgi:hypothetical protein
MEEVDRDLVEHALREHQTLPLRAESHKAFSALFVDEDQLHLLDTPDWQVVYGRRGTGKTLFLKTREEHLLAAPAVTRILPLYISMQDVIVSPPVGIAASERQQAYANFQLFLERLADEISSKATALLAEFTSRKEASFFRALIGRGDRPPADAAKIDAIVRDLVTFMQTGDLLAAFSDASVDETLTQRSASESSRGGHGRVQLSPEGIAASGEAQVRRSRAEEEEAQRSERRSGRPTPRFSNLRHALVELATALEVDRIDVFIDEWSLLDPTGASSVQPRFAALLRRALFGDPRITVKIATNRYNTVFLRHEPTARYGLQPNADVFEAVNLDRALVKRADRTAFYEELLFKRLLLKEPMLARYANPDGRPGAGFAETFFETSEAFDELVAGCEGVPRDFIITFRYLTQWANYSVSPKWTKEDVRHALMEVSMGAVDQMVYGSPATELLERGIKETATQTGARIFLIRRDAPEEICTALSLLLDQRLIHEYVGKGLPTRVRQLYLPYSIAYGLWWEWERLREHAGTESPDEVPSFASDEEVARHTVDIELQGDDRGEP